MTDLYPKKIGSLDLALFAKSSESRDTFSRLSSMNDKVSRASTPIHMSTSRYTHFSPSFSGKASLRAAYLKDTDQGGKLREEVEKCLRLVSDASRSADELKAMLPAEKRSVLKGLTSQVDDEVRKRGVEIGRHKSALVTLQEDLQAQLAKLDKAENSQELLRRWRLEMQKISGELREELARTPASELALTLKHRKEDYTDVDTYRHASLSANFDEKFDSFVASQISNIAQMLPEAKGGRITAEDLQEGLYTRTQTEAALEALRTAVSEFVGHIQGSQNWGSVGESRLQAADNSLLTRQVGELKLQIQQMSGRHQAELLSKEREWKAALKKQHDELEGRLKELQNETTEEVSSAKELLKTDYEQLQTHKNYLKLQVQNLEEELRSSNKTIERLQREQQEFDSEKERIALELEHAWSCKLDHAKRVFTDQYEELGRVTTSQISALENQLAAGLSHNDIIEDAIKCRLSREIEAKYAALIERSSKLHLKQIRLKEEEFEDFVQKTQDEISRLTGIISQCLASDNSSTLMSSLHFELNSISKRLSGSMRMSKEVCRRCGQAGTGECKFHPYLAKHDSAELLYTNEWHRCREERHTEDMPGCFSLPIHSNIKYSTLLSPSYFLTSSLSPDGPTFAAKSRKSSQRASKERIKSAMSDLKSRISESPHTRLVSPNKSNKILARMPDLLDEALFSSTRQTPDSQMNSAKKGRLFESATARLDEYMAKAVANVL